MNEAYLKIIEGMGYKLVKIDDKLRLFDREGKEIESKSYTIGNNDVIKFNDVNNKKSISLFSNGIVEIGINGEINILISHNKEKLSHTIKMEFDVSKDIQFDDSMKTISFVIYDKVENRPGAIVVYSNGHAIGTISQYETFYTIDGGFRDIKGSNTDNYIKIIDKNILNNVRGWRWCKLMRKGFDIVSPGLRVCIDGMLECWEDSLDNYLDTLMRKKEKLQEELSDNNKEIRIVNRIIESKDAKRKK